MSKNITQFTPQTVSADPTSLFYTVTGGAIDKNLPLSVLVNNLGLTGIPTTTTAAASTNTTQIASCAFAQSAITLALSGIYAPLSNPAFTGTVVIPTVTLSGGTITGTAIDSSAIGATTPSTGKFTTVITTGVTQAATLTTPNASITGGSINNTTVGATTPASGAFTTLVATGAITPSQTSGIVGTTTNNSANAGSVGEVISSSIASPGGSITNLTAANVTSISLTAGDWDVWGDIFPIPSGSALITQMRGTITTTTAAIGAVGDPGCFFQQISLAAGVGGSIKVGTVRLNLASTTTVFLVTQLAFSAGTCTAFGQIFARRRR